MSKINIEKGFYNGKRCPKCHEEGSIVKIEYGYPGEKMREDYESGEIRLGGCTIEDSNPDYHCNKCDNEWGKTYYDEID
mgnify:CR=1 FL=1